jgi:hypothetical protein
MSTSPLRIDVPGREAVPGPPANTLPAPKELHIEPDAWRALAATQADALVVGAGVAALRVLIFIWPTLHKPIFWCESRRLSLPARSEGTLVLENAHALDAVDQQRLLEWLHGGTEPLRLIATSAPVIFPLVEEGKFSRELYDRLTAVKLVVA